MSTGDIDKNKIIHIHYPIEIGNSVFNQDSNKLLLWLQDFLDCMNII